MIEYSAVPAISASPPPPSHLELAALIVAQCLGLPVFPLIPRDKKPLSPNGFKDATTHPEQIARWWTTWPDANIGMPTGSASGVFVLDVDGADGAAALAANFPPLPPTVTVETGKGLHYWFRMPDGDPLGNSARRLGPQLDSRGDGGYIVIPPSVHPSGHVYRWADGCSPDDIDMAPLPDAIRDALQPPSRPAEARTHAPRALTLTAADREPLARFRAWLRTVDCGLADGQGRNHTAYRIARRALEVLPLSDVREVVAAWNSLNHPPLDDCELTMVINSAAGIRRGRAAA